MVTSLQNKTREAIKTWHCLFHNETRKTKRTWCYKVATCFFKILKRWTISGNSSIDNDKAFHIFDPMWWRLKLILAIGRNSDGKYDLQDVGWFCYCELVLKIIENLNRSWSKASSWQIWELEIRWIWIIENIPEDLYTEAEQSLLKRILSALFCKICIGL